VVDFANMGQTAYLKKKNKKQLLEFLANSAECMAKRALGWNILPIFFI